MAVPEHPSRNEKFHTTIDADRLERDPLDTMPAGSFESSNVHSALYDFGERTMFARYKRDGADAIYKYWDVPAQVWNGLQAASSKGSYINQYVAYEFRYSKYGRGDFPDRKSLDSDFVRMFVYAP